MALDQLLGPLINGHRFDYSSVEINLGGTIYTAVQEITYSHSLEPGYLRGTKPQKIGRTRGEYNAEASIKLYKADYHNLTQMLSLLNPIVGYMEASFTITVIYQEIASSGQLITDVLSGCRMTKAENSHSQSSDALQVSVDLDVMQIVENLLIPVYDNTVA
jgi:hypothetical protein